MDRSHITAGGTEILKRGQRPAHTGCHLEPKCPIPGRRGCGACLRQAVEEAAQAGRQDALASARHERQQFWIDTCRDVTEMRSASRQVLDLYRKYGCRFTAPSPQEVQSILDALDSALPGWERSHAELFYQTLELNFPRQLRVCRVPRRT